MARVRKTRNPKFEIRNELEIRIQKSLHGQPILKSADLLRLNLFRVLDLGGRNSILWHPEAFARGFVVDPSAAGFQHRRGPLRHGSSPKPWGRWFGTSAPVRKLE